FNAGAGTFDEQPGFGQTVVEHALIEIELDEDRLLAGLGPLKHRGDSSADQASPPSWTILTGRAGTTVEMACLYTICVTVFLSRTTYWSKESIWPCSLMPLTR